MLHFNTDMPYDAARLIVAGAGYAEPIDRSDTWRTALHVQDRFAMGVMSAIADLGFVASGRRPERQAIGDPTFALAAARVDRTPSGNAAPAAAYAR